MKDEMTKQSGGQEVRKVRLLGRPGSPEAYEIRDFLGRSVVG